MKKSLIQHAIDNDVINISQGINGTKYKVKCNINAPDGRTPCIYTVWIIYDDDINGKPSLVSAYPVKHKK